LLRNIFNSWNFIKYHLIISTTTMTISSPPLPPLLSLSYYHLDNNHHLFLLVLYLFFHHLITVIIISLTIIKKYFTYKKIFFKLNIMDVKYFMQNKHTRTSHTEIKSGIETMFLVYKNLKLTRLMRKMLRKNSL